MRVNLNIHGYKANFLNWFLQTDLLETLMAPRIMIGPAGRCSLKTKFAASSLETRDPGDRRMHLILSRDLQNTGVHLNTLNVPAKKTI